MNSLGKKIKMKLHANQMIVANAMLSKGRPRIGVLACGARWGKDRLSLTLMLSLSHYMAVAERKRRMRAGLVPLVLCWYVAPTFGLLRQAWEEMLYFTSSIPGIKIDHSNMRIFFKNGIQMEFKSADKPGSLLARGLDMIVCTEASRMKREAWENALLTRLSSPGRGVGGKGGLALLNSTPCGKNWFYELYTKGLEDSSGTVKSWHFTSYDNPCINKDEIDRHKSLMPERAFRQEYLAEFIDGAGSVFRGIANAFENYDFPIQNNPIFRYSIGIDWGRHNDRTAVVVLQFENDGTIRLANCASLYNMEFSNQMVHIKAIIDKYPGANVIAECNGLGDPLVEQLYRFSNKKITPFLTTNTSKRAIVEGCAFLFEKGSIKLPSKTEHGVYISQCPILTDELSDYSVTETRGGNFTYSAPSGKHDDYVMAFCMAVEGRRIANSNATLVGIED